MNIGVVGAGPVGLFFAKKMVETSGVDVNITLFEYRKYKRRQVLLLQPHVFEELEDLQSELLKYGCYVHPPAKDKDAKCYKSPLSNGHFSIRTDKLEQILRADIEGLSNIDFVNEKVTDIDMLAEYDFDILISASGGRDPLPEAIGNVYQSDYLSHAIIFNFKVNSPDSYYQTSTVSDKVKKYLAQHRFRGFRTTADSYYIGIQLGKSEADEITGTSDTDEIKFKDLPKRIKGAFNDALKKYEMTDDVRRKTIEVSVFPIYKRRATVYADYLASLDAEVYLIGDSLSTTHFFSGQGVNVGCESALTAIDAILDTNGIEYYNDHAEEYILKLKDSSEQVTVDMDKLNKMCKEYTREEIYDIARENNLIPEGLTKRNVCLSLLHIDKFK